MCGEGDETVNHLVGERSNLAQREYKRRHDWVGRRVHWEVIRYMTSKKEINGMNMMLFQ